MQQFSEYQLNLLRVQISVYQQLAQNVSISDNTQDVLNTYKLIASKPKRRYLPTLDQISQIPAEVFLQQRHTIPNSIYNISKYANAFKREKYQTLYEARFPDRVDIKYRIQKNKTKQAERQRMLSDIMQRKQKITSLKSVKELFAEKIKAELLAAKEPVKVEPEEQELDEERMRCLLQKDEVRYRQLINKKKDKRLAHLLDQTDEFLRNLAQMVKQHKKEHDVENIKVSSKDRRLCKYEMLCSGKYMIPEAIDKIAANERVTVKNMRTEVCLRNEQAPKLIELYEWLKENPDWYWDAGETDDEEEQDDKYVAEESLDYYSTVHTQMESINKQASIMLNGKLKDYQLKGLEWLVSLYNNNLNGILADEMGLGKTIQTIALITYLMEQKKLLSPYLIIVPLSTLANWELEFQKWAPSVVVISYRGTPQNRKSLQKALHAQNFNVVLTTYEYVIKDRPVLAKLHWQYLIVDEGHRMKNPNCKLTGVLNTYYYRASHRLLLTGTPLQNKLPELWALLNFLLPTIFNCCATFEQWFNAPFATIGETVELNEEETILIIRRLHSVLRPFLLRRLKKEVEHQLPEKVEYVIKCEMSALQSAFYSKMQRTGELLKSPVPSGTNIKVKKLLNTIVQLRKLCNHPFMFAHIENIYVEHTRRQVNGTDLYRVSGKFELLDRILPKLKASNHRVLLFCQMTQCMSILEDYLTCCQIKYLRLDGSTKSEDRGALLAKFNDPESKYFMFLLSTRAGGLGLNLQAADTVIIFDSDWNPHQDLQAQDRAHRIGQCNEVRVLRLVTINTVEERILMSARNKLSMDEKVIQAGMFDQKSTDSQRKDLLESILKQNDMNEDNEIPNDDTINTMLARTEDELELFKQMDIQRKKCSERELPYGRLLQECEIPQFPPSKEEEPEPAIDRVSRLRKKPNFPEAITEEEFLKAVGSTEDDEPTTSAKKAKTETTKKKATPAPKSIKKGPPPQSLLQEILQHVISYKNDGQVLSRPYMQLPTKRKLPDYYRVIKNPMDIKKMQKRIVEDYYQNLNDFKKDFMLLCKNARVYNEDESDLFQHSILLQKEFIDIFERLTQTQKPASSKKKGRGRKRVRIT